MKTYLKTSIVVGILALVTSLTFNTAQAERIEVNNSSEITCVQADKPITNLSIKFTANSVSELNKIDLSGLESLITENADQSCTVTITVEVSIGVASVALSAEAKCENVVEKTQQLVKQARAVAASTM